VVELKFEKTRSDRFFEKIPPIVTLSLILFPVVGSFFIPQVVAIFVILFNVFFLYRSIAFTIQFALGTIFLRQAEQIDWQAKVEGLSDIEKEIKSLRDSLNTIKKLSYKDTRDSLAIKYRHPHYKDVFKLPWVMQVAIFRWEKFKTVNFIRSEISKLSEIKDNLNFNWHQINHVIMIPHAKEPLQVLDNTLSEIAKQTFPLKQIHLVLGAEARDEEGYEKSVQLQKKYGKIFGNIWVTNHVLKEDEIVGKSSNMAHAGREAVKEIMKLGWDLSKTTVTSCDADSRLPKEYFSYLTYEYVTRFESKYKFFTGAILLYANIWRLDPIARVRNSLSSMFNVGKLVRPDKLIPFSTYTTSFWLVDQIGYWTPWVTPEDFHLFFKSSFHFPHKVSTIPLFTKIYVDAAEGDTYVESFKNNYMQSRRWQWGVSDDGWMIKNMVMNIGKYSFMVYYRGIHVLVDHILAPSSAFLLMLGANLPPLLNARFGGQVFGAKLPGISETILQITFLSFIVAIFFDYLVKPKRDGVSLLRKIVTPFEFIINPIVGLTLTSIPGIEAHTRLLFGKYLEYYITKKKA